MSVEIATRFTKPLCDVTSLTDRDFETKRDLKSAVARFAKNLRCPQCGSSRLSSFGVEAEAGPVNLYEAIEVRRLFGGSRNKDVKRGTYFRLHDIYLKPGRTTFFPNAGSISCRAKGCRWRVSAGSGGGGGITWLSISDIGRMLGGE